MVGGGGGVVGLVGVGVGVELAPTMFAKTAETPFCVMVRTASTMNGCCV